MDCNKNQSLKCSQVVRNIPLERFRLPADGRKWKQAARSRSGLLSRLATYANGDGTFVRNGRNYSPSLETLQKHVGHGSYYRLTEDLQNLRLLSWIRERHYDRRIYTIHLENASEDSQEKQVPDSLSETGPTFNNQDEKQVPDSAEQVPHSQKTGPTMDSIRLLPSVPSKPSYRPEPKSGDGIDSGENLTDKRNGNHSAEMMVDYENVFCRFQDDINITLSEDTKTKLKSQFGDASEDVLRKAFRNLRDRDMGWDGLDRPAAIILKEFPACLIQAKRDVERELKKKADDERAERVGKEYLRRKQEELFASMCED